jgi:hypothetical protein
MELDFIILNNLMKLTIIRNESFSSQLINNLGFIIFDRQINNGQL